MDARPSLVHDYSVSAWSWKDMELIECDQSYSLWKYLFTLLLRDVLLLYTLETCVG